MNSVRCLALSMCKGKFSSACVLPYLVVYHSIQMVESVVKYSYNGTEYSFVSKDPAQIEDLKCPICLELVYEPVLTSCGHLFCQRCVWEETKCPTCQNELQCMRNQRDEHKVKGLKVKCPNWEKGLIGTRYATSEFEAFITCKITVL